MSGYWLKLPGQTHWREVDKSEYVVVERASGFHNTMGRPDEPATASFSGGDGTQGTTFEPTPVAVAGFDPEHNYYDRTGKPITVEQWAEMRSRERYRILARDHVGDGDLITAWLGLVEPSIYDARLFGTALANHEGVHQIEVYDTEEDAMEGHARHHLARMAGHHCELCRIGEEHAD